MHLTVESYGQAVFLEFDPALYLAVNVEILVARDLAFQLQ